MPRAALEVEVDLDDYKGEYDTLFGSMGKFRCLPGIWWDNEHTTTGTTMSSTVYRPLDCTRYVMRRARVAAT